MKTIKIKDETWKELMRLKIDWGKPTIDKTIATLLKLHKEERR